MLFKKNLDIKCMYIGSVLADLSIKTTYSSRGCWVWVAFVSPKLENPVFSKNCQNGQN